MRILKYLFLLLLLSLVALSIFIATQKGDFLIERSKIINSPKSSVFNYVNDYRNWSDFGSWTAEDPEIKITYPQNTIGTGASFSWEGKEGNGKMKTISVKENDSITQKMEFNGTTSSVFWNFKDTIGGTKVTWKTKGKMSFLFKVYTALNGGVDKVIGTIYEKSLTNLDRALDYEINTYSIKVNGLVQKTPVFYLGQTFTSELAKVNKNFKIVIPVITKFCTANNLIINGKPFIIYHTYDVKKELARISICIPIKDEIFLSAGSDIVSGKLELMEAVKTTLTGDYSHNKTGYDKTVNFLNQKRLSPNPIFSHLEIYTISKSEIKNPSKWITEIYIPVISKTIPAAKSLDSRTTLSESQENTATEPTYKTIDSKKTPVKINDEESEF